MIEQLETRLQYASISGQVFHDADNSETFDANESAYKGWQVYIDANANGQFDAGETSTTTDSKGNYTFKDLPHGTYLIGVNPPSTDYLQTTPGPDGALESAVHINVNFDGSASASVRKAFVDAAERWESILTGVMLNGGIANDTVNIDAKVAPIDGAEGILGFAGPTAVNDATGLPSAGSMQFDSADLAQLNADNQLTDVITHEMAHVLGFGTVWAQKQVSIANNSSNPRFIGANAVAAFNQLFGTDNISIPLENKGQEGTRDAHWKETVMTQELMTGYISFPGEANPLSIITVGQFQDLGYAVDYKPADAWTPATETVTQGTPLNAGGLAEERGITVQTKDNATGADFGYRINVAPVIGNFTITPAPVAEGTLLTLSASKILNFDGDPFAGVSFWRESNGIPGLQKGVGGDTYVSTKTMPHGHAFSAQTATDTLSTGDQIYYAIASDTLGAGSRRQGVVTITSSTIPDRPTNVVATRQNSTSALLTFDDPATDIGGFHIRLAVKSSFASESLVRVFNISPDSRSVILTDLTPGTQYFLDLRPYNSAGSGIYTAPITFETI